MKNPIAEARRRLSEVLASEEKLCALLVQEDRAASTEEDKQLQQIDADKKRLNDQIARLEALEAEQKRAAEVRTPEAKVERETTSVRVTREDGEDENGHYRPFRTRGEQFQAVHRASKPGSEPDKRLVELNKRAAAGLNEGVGAEGGFLVQDDYSTELLKNAFATGLIAPRCRTFPLSPNSNGITFPVLQETSRVDGSRWGGVQVYRVNEAGAATKSKPKFAVERLGLEKLIGMCVATDEMLADASFLGAWINEAFAEEFAVKIDNEIIRGSGAGQMRGVLNAGCLVSVAKETSQAAATINGMNCVKMFARLFGRAQSNSVWLANQDCFPQIATLTITKDKSDIPIYQPANIASGQTLGTILGRPVVYVEQASTVGTQGDLILGDFSRYMLVSKDPAQASSIHVYFDTEQTAFRFSVRNNGQPMLKQAITPMNGSSTLTDFVVLDTRS